MIFIILIPAYNKLRNMQKIEFFLLRDGHLALLALETM